MRDLTQHLTTRADDSRAPPVFSSSEEELDISIHCDQCQGLVRFFALRRIKPHTPPLVRAPVNSLVLIALTPAQKGSIPPTPSTHRLRPGLPGYLIPFAPLAFVPQRQLSSRKPLSPLVFLLISTHFTATLGILLSSPILQSPSFRPLTGLSPALLRQT